MDNKVSLWVPDLSSVVSGLKNYSAHNSGFGYMTRQSSYSDGITVGHVLVPVEARVIELVGDISILDEKDRVGFDSWAEEECPFAQRLDHMPSLYASEYATSSFTEWGEKSAPMLIGMSVASASATAEASLLTSLHSRTGVQASHNSTVSGTCEVSTLRWPSMSDFRVRYVTNTAAHTGSNSVADYSIFIKDVHEIYTTQGVTWNSWDHFLDQHIGLMFAGDGDGCAAEGDAVQAMLEERPDVPVGARKKHGKNITHFYTGYEGSMTWEYWFACTWPAATKRDIVDVCTCVPENSDVSSTAAGFECPNDDSSKKLPTTPPMNNTVNASMLPPP